MQRIVALLKMHNAVKLDFIKLILRSNTMGQTQRPQDNPQQNPKKPEGKPDPSRQKERKEDKENKHR